MTVVDAKQEILARIRSAQRSAELPASVTAPRDYNRIGTTDLDELQTLLIDRLEDYRAEVHVTSTGELASSIVAILTQRNAHNVKFAPGVDPGLFADFTGTALSDDPATDPRELNAVDAVVTESTVSCAQTGTIVLTSGEKDGRRAFSLVPDRHICIVRAESIVFGVPEMIAHMDPSRPSTLISGPSATSDIELSRVEGVHGPRDLIVVIVR
ncbi:MAG: LUD domain-containing protein [Corynebacterium sp.]|nr:LUD domain-containing protein [Corynebacterium sp.]